MALERGAQFVGDDGEEFVFEAIGAFGLVACGAFAGEQFFALGFRPFAIGDVDGNSDDAMPLLAESPRNISPRLSSHLMSSLGSTTRYSV